MHTKVGDREGQLDEFWETEIDIYTTDTLYN